MIQGPSLKALARRQRFNSIRTSLSALPVMHQTTNMLEVRLEKNRSRKSSAIFTDRETTLSKVFSDEDSEEEERFRSLFKDKYTLGEKIGEGAHGVVRHCTEKSTERGFAVKTITLDREHILFLKKNFTDIKALKHEHVIGYHALFFQMGKQTCHLVMEYLPFHDLLHMRFTIDQHLLKELIYQLLQTLCFIHTHKICHRDIKPENILFDHQKTSVKVIDFGISKKLIDRGRKKEMLTLTGTPYYRAPEMFEGGGYDERVDLWALGVTMFKLMTGATPFESEYHSETIANIMRGEYAYPGDVQQKFSKSCRNLVGRLLKKRSQRLTAEEAIRDMWFIDLLKKKQLEKQELSLSANAMIMIGGNHSDEWNNNSMIDPNKFKLKLNEKSKLPPMGGLEGKKSLKDILKIDEQESMIYGCEQPSKKGMGASGKMRLI